MIQPAVLAAWALATLLATRWFLRRTTLRLWEWVAAFLLAVPVALWLAWLWEGQPLDAGPRPCDLLAGRTGQRNPSPGASPGRPTSTGRQP